MTTPSTSTRSRTPRDTPDPYGGFLSAVRGTFAERTRTAAALFRVDTAGLWDHYFHNLSDPAPHNCRTCYRFVERYAGLVRVNDDGTLRSLLWDETAVPTYYAAATLALRRAVESRPIVGAAVYDTAKSRLLVHGARGGVLLGDGVTGEWSHPEVVVPFALCIRPGLRTAHEVAAGIAHNVETVETALHTYPAALLAEALRILEADALTRAEKFVGPVRWLLNLHAGRDAAAKRSDGSTRAHVLWERVATAPEGFCHPRASMVGTLLDDLAAGLPFGDVQRRWTEKMRPTAYQRPTAAPAAGNIAAAERIVERLGLAPALARRFARLDECETAWTPTKRGTWPPSVPAGVFGAVARKRTPTPMPGVVLPDQTMTWDKFVRTVLPTADRLELYVPEWGWFIGLTSAADMDAPPIIRWDRPERRNPVSWYVYSGGSSAATWSLSAREWHDVTAVVPLPNLWGPSPAPYHAVGAVLVLAGAVDRNNSSAVLFPEHMRDELHGARATIEAYSATATLSGAEEASACGYDFRKGFTDKRRVRVTSDGHVTTYTLDRWD